MNNKPENDLKGTTQLNVKPQKQGVMTKLRNYFFTGLVITGPIGITLYLSWSLIQLIDGWILPWIPEKYNPDTYLTVEVPGVGLIVVLIALTLLGFLTANIAGRTLLSIGESIVGRMPLVRNIYSALKQIFETVLQEKGQTFTKAGLVEYPRKGLWAIVFLATNTKGEVAAKLEQDDEMVSVFLPTTPNPTSGFLLFVPKKDIMELEMSVEDAAKLVISAGLVSPEYPKKLAGIKELEGEKGPTHKADSKTSS